MTTNNRYFRPCIAAMEGYVPGEQPKDKILLKLNTNENPFPPSPRVTEVLNQFDPGRLRLYPDPDGNRLRDAIAQVHGCTREQVILGNGSDDILTISFRSFAGEGDRIACFNPSYSLYPVLAKLQNAGCIEIPLEADFSCPLHAAEMAEGAVMLIITRPNAPTGNAFPLSRVKQICRDFPGIVLIDEAYAEFADDHCIGLLGLFPNVIISRTLSKSHSLAGLRLGYALASEEIIAGMMKVRDSYNVDMLTQEIALASVQDREYLQKNVREIRNTRDFFMGRLREMGFRVCPSQTNFVFVSPPDGLGAAYFAFLRENHILVRYFSGPITQEYVRISIGTREDMERLLAVTEGWRV